MSPGPPIVLVNMPYGYLPAPSLALGLLKARLVDAGLPTETRYANIAFAEKIGAGLYVRLSGKTWMMLGEWTFAGSAFPDFQPDHDAYLGAATVSAIQPDPAAAAAKCWAVRQAAADFVESLALEIAERRPRIVGCSSVFQQHCASLALLRRVKELDPDVLTMIGGANCEGEMGRATILSFPWLDVVVSGEADELLVPLCARLLAEGPRLDVETAPPGVFGAGHRAAWSAGKEPPAGRAVVSDLDGLPIPDYDEYFATLAGSEIAAAVTPALLVETSRGCWWGARSHCTFCGLNGTSMSFRSKSADRAYEELRYLAERHQVHRFSVVDNILDLRYFDDLLPRLAEEQPGWSLFYEVKANLSRERLEMLSRAGVEWIQPGLEAIHDGPLSLMAKGTSAAINIQTLKWARSLGVHCLWSILVGLPGERLEWFPAMTEIAEQLVHLQPPMGWNTVVFDRFSPYHSRPESFDLELEATWQHSWIYPLDGETMQELAYHFQDRRQPRGLIERAPGDGHPPLSLAHPDVQRFFASIERWRELFWAELPPILAVEESEDQSSIFDTRPCAVEQNTVLRGRHHRVHQLCDSARTFEAIHRGVERREGQKVREDQVRAVVDDLVERNLVLPTGGRYLALAVAGEVPTLDGMRHFPGGYVHHEDLPAARRERRPYLPTLPTWEPCEA